MLALSGLAWLETIALMTAGGSPRGGSARGGSAARMAMPGMAMPGPSSTARGWTLGAWALMVVAMMLPLTIGPLRSTAARSLWRRRRRAIVEYLAAFVAVWLLAGCVVIAASVVVGPSREHVSRWALPAGLVLAAAWQVTPWKRRALRACHRTAPLAPSGWRAVRDCLRYGADTARSCLRSCGIAMAALALGAASLTTMLVVTSVVVVECYSLRPRAAASAGVLVLLAAVTLVL